MVSAFNASDSLKPAVDYIINELGISDHGVSTLLGKNARVGCEVALLLTDYNVEQCQRAAEAYNHHIENSRAYSMARREANLEIAQARLNEAEQSDQPNDELVAELRQRVVNLQYSIDSEREKATSGFITTDSKLIAGYIEALEPVKEQIAGMIGDVSENFHDSPQLVEGVARLITDSFVKAEGIIAEEGALNDYVMGDAAIMQSELTTHMLINGVDYDAATFMGSMMSGLVAVAEAEQFRARGLEQHLIPHGL
ncbi:hypothetical protein GC177_10080 [bacterium]|nr:hypothetical protein [bacterium]